MVGAEACNMKLSAISKEFIGKPYSLGECDCFSVVRDYLSANGVTLPTEYAGYDIVNGYAELWETDPDRAKGLMMAFFAEHTESIPAHAMKAGDILHLRTGNSHFCGIHGGHGHVIGASPEMGVTLFKIADYEVVGVYRCRS